MANFAFRYFITSEVGGISLAGVAIGVINAFLPMEEINKRLFPDRPDFNEILTYEEAVRELDTVIIHIVIYLGLWKSQPCNTSILQ